MGIASQVLNGGWGALVIYAYAYLVLLHWNVTNGRIAAVVAAIPALIVMFSVVVLNHWLNDFWAGGNLQRSTEEIDRITGENDSYHSASKEIQETIDEFDEKAYGHHVAILSGLVVGIAAPVTGFVAIGLRGALVGIVGSLLAIRVLSIRSHRELNRLADDLSTPYVENYENQ
jgi:hypothetical protein